MPNKELQDLTEAGRIVNEINNLKNALNDILEMGDIRGNIHYLLEDYVSMIETSECDLLNNVKLPHCEWAKQ